MHYDFVLLCNRSDQVHLSARVDDVAVWMLPNRLQLNTDKTDLLWCATARRCHQLPTSALRMGFDFINPSTSVRDLRIYFDADLSMRYTFRKPLPAASPFTPAVQYPTFSSDVCVPDACCRPRLVTARLRQCCGGGLTRLPVQPLTIGTQRCRAINR